METTDTINTTEAYLAASSHQDLYLRYPLDPSSSQIRVFTLLPALDPQAPLQGQLRVEDLKSRPATYEALSYVWGGSEQQRHLCIENTHLAITDNLHAVLRQLRDSSDSRDLWIDAICINQGNLQEKNRQVRQMYDIYCLASKVLMWLGEGNAESDEMFSQLSDHDSKEHIYLDISDSREVKAVAWDNFFSRPWWQRVWTLQEGLAASIHSRSLLLCGNKSTNWLNLRSTRREWLSKRIVPRMYYAPVDDFLDSCTRYEEAYRHVQGTDKWRLTFGDMFWASIGREASDNRDYVFALLGPLERTDEHSLEPNYTKPLDLIFQQAMVSIIASTGNLDALLLKVNQGPTAQPSWCLDFRFRQKWKRWRDKIFHIPSCNSQNYDSYQCQSFSLHKDTFSVRTSVRSSIDLGTITLPGITIGSVATSHMLDEGEIKGLQYKWKFHDWSKCVKEFLDAHHAHQAVSRLSVDCTYRIGLGWTCIFVTDTNALGLSPQEIVKGDVLAILNGAKLPFLLRRQEDFSYRVIGVGVGDYIDDEPQLDIRRPNLETDFVLT